MVATERFVLKGLDCPNCAAQLEQALRAEEGLEETKVSFATLSVELDPAHLARARRIIAALEPGVEVVPVNADRADAAAEGSTRGKTVATFLMEQRPAVARLVLAGLLLGLGAAFAERLHVSPLRFLEYLVFGTAYLLVGWKVVATAIRNALHGNLFDEHSLMTIATLGAAALHQLPEAVTVMLLYTLGEALQDFAVGRARRSISALVSVRPEKARVRRGTEWVVVSPEEVEVGTTILIQPGERVPLDGTVAEGEALVDTSALTGEPVPRRVARGGQVLAGMVNTSGVLELRVERQFGESAIARVLQLVEAAAGRKARAERFLTSFSRYYTPAMVGLAAAIAVIPPLVIPGATFSTWVYRALVLLVISCPCALVVSVPLGYFGGLGAASRHGILVKGANFLDVLAGLETVVFDKTGTLTEGSFKVRSIHPHNGCRAEEVLATAALVEAASPHPIAASILAAYGRLVDAQALSEYQEVPGYGVRGRIEGRLIVAGNDRFMHQEGAAHDEAVCGVSGTVVHVAADGTYLGYIVIADQVKAGAPEAIAELRRLGVRQVHLLSGDDPTAAGEVGRAVGLDRVWAGLLPGDKVAKVEELVAVFGRGRLAFVGDGINDAPVLTRADVGIAMGALGSEAAIEAADVVIMDDQLAKLPLAVRLARRTRRVVTQNIGFALGVKGAFMILGALGISGIWTAVFADMGVSVLAVLNSLRTLHFGGGRA